MTEMSRTGVLENEPLLLSCCCENTTLLKLEYAGRTALTPARVLANLTGLRSYVGRFFFALNGSELSKHNRATIYRKGFSFNKFSTWKPFVDSLLAVCGPRCSMKKGSRVPVRVIQEPVESRHPVALELLPSIALSSTEQPQSTTFYEEGNGRILQFLHHAITPFNPYETVTEFPIR